MQLFYFATVSLVNIHKFVFKIDIYLCSFVKYGIVTTVSVYLVKNIPLKKTR